MKAVFSPLKALVPDDFPAPLAQHPHTKFMLADGLTVQQL